YRHTLTKKSLKLFFNHLNCIITSSILLENSLLMIPRNIATTNSCYYRQHKAKMDEYIHYEINGLLFEHRNEKAYVSKYNV
ncbi:MAG: hypothetical protein ACTS7E_04595, partial [Arsenophonus sp. NC-CH8-MAG3]